MNRGEQRDLGAHLVEGALSGAAVGALLGVWVFARTLPQNTLEVGSGLALGAGLVVLYATPGLFAGAGAAFLGYFARRGRGHGTLPGAAAVALALGLWVPRGRLEIIGSPVLQSVVGVLLAVLLIVAFRRLLRPLGRWALPTGWLAIALLLLVVGFGRAYRDSPRDPNALDALRASDQPSAPLLVIGLDGVEPEILDDMRARGVVPNLDRLFAGGAVGRMQSLEPTWSPPIWTTMWTGRLPRDHGITFFLSEGTYAIPGLGSEVVLPRIFGLQRAAELVFEEKVVPVTSELRRATAVWEAAGLAGRSSVLANRMVGWPAQPLRGVELTNRLLLDAVDLPALTFPDSLAKEVGPRIRVAERLDDPALAAAPWLAIQLAREREMWRIAATKSVELGADLTLVYTHLIDSAQHRYLKYHWTDRFRFTPDPRNVELFGGAIEATYRAVDAMIGEVISILGPDHRILVVSDHGVRPNLQIGADVAEPVGAERMPPAPLDEVSGVHGDAPDGVFCLFGPGVRPGGLAHTPHVLEVAPLVLHLLGLPVPDDLERVSPLDHDPSLVADVEPMRTVGSFEGLLPRKIRTQTSAADDQILEQLRALGYIE